MDPFTGLIDHWGRGEGVPKVGQTVPVGSYVCNRVKT